MIVGAGAHAMMATGADQMALNKLADMRNQRTALGQILKEAAQNFKKLTRNRKQNKPKRIYSFSKNEGPRNSCERSRPTDAQLLGGRGNLKKLAMPEAQHYPLRNKWVPLKNVLTDEVPAPHHRPDW